MSHVAILVFIIHQLPILSQKLLEHILLSLSAIGIAVAIGLPAGIFVHYQPKLRGSILGSANIFQTIPSLALLAFFIPFLGIGVKPTIVVLTIYALLPIVRNTFEGIKAVPQKNIEAANGLGFTRWQRLRMIELPLAMPLIFAGIRTATAMTIGITTIAAFIGAGGLGDFITQGLALDSTRLILLGAIPAALLALALDYVLAQAALMLDRRRWRSVSYKVFKVVFSSLILLLLLVPFFRLIFASQAPQRDDTIVIASKNFTEQFILGQMMAQLIRQKTSLHVITKFNLGSTAILQAAILNNGIDLYPEYTGSAYLTVLHKTMIKSPKATFNIVKREYKKKFNLIWLKPFGFSNSQALAVSQSVANQYHLTSISDLSRVSSRLTIGAPAAFLKRADAFPGLKRVYHLHFKHISLMQPDLMYRAIHHHSVQVIMAFTTDARIKAYHLVLLKDDKHFFPPYAAAPIIRGAILKQHPNIRTALASLSGAITNKTMQALNYDVAIKGQSPKQVAHAFLNSIEQTISNTN